MKSSQDLEGAQQHAGGYPWRTPIASCIGGHHALGGHPLGIPPTSTNVLVSGFFKYIIICLTQEAKAFQKETKTHVARYRRKVNYTFLLVIIIDYDCQVFIFS